MRVKDVTYGCLRNIGNYENVRAEVTVELQEGDKPDEAFKVAEDWVKWELDKMEAAHRATVTR